MLPSPAADLPRPVGWSRIRPKALPIGSAAYGGGGPVEDGLGGGLLAAAQNLHGLVLILRVTRHAWDSKHGC